MRERHLEGLVDAGTHPPRETTETGYDFAAVVSRHETALLRYVGEILGRRLAEETEDLVQEAFLRLHRQVTERGESSVRNVPGWLFRVGHNLAMDAVRKRRRRGGDQAAVPREIEDVKDGMDPLGEMMQREAYERALAELRKLPEELERLLLLKIIQGMTLREIGKVTGLTTSQVGHRIDRALREVTRRLKGEGLL